jgi:hypothetical protein
VEHVNCEVLEDDCTLSYCSSVLREQVLTIVRASNVLNITESCRFNTRCASEKVK